MSLQTRVDASGNEKSDQRHYHRARMCQHLCCVGGRGHRHHTRAYPGCTCGPVWPLFGNWLKSGLLFAPVWSRQVRKSSPDSQAGQALSGLLLSSLCLLCQFGLGRARLPARSVAGGSTQRVVACCGTSDRLSGLAGLLGNGPC